MYLVFIIAGVYPSPLWGGESLFSLWFVLAMAAVGFLPVLMMRARLSASDSFLVGVVLLLLEMPAIFVFKLAIAPLAIVSYEKFFAAFAVFYLGLSYLAVIGVPVFRKIVTERMRSWS
jgi:hypothetical protein